MEWISVKDRLPKKETNVMFFSTKDGIYIYNTSYVTWITAIDRIHGITHWMPLPSPPES